jgi:hypothetical protein
LQGADKNKNSLLTGFPGAPFPLDFLGWKLYIRAILICTLQIEKSGMKNPSVTGCLAGGIPNRKSNHAQTIADTELRHH